MALDRVPGGIRQVKYQRLKLRDQHAKDVLAKLIEKCKDLEDKFFHTLRKYCRNAYRAVVGESPYTLAPSYRQL